MLEDRTFTHILIGEQPSAKPVYSKILVNIQFSISLQPCNCFRKWAYHGAWSEYTDNCSIQNISGVAISAAQERRKLIASSRASKS